MKSLVIQLSVKEVVIPGISKSGNTDRDIDGEVREVDILVLRSSPRAVGTWKSNMLDDYLGD